MKLFIVVEDEDEEAIWCEEHEMIVGHATEQELLQFACTVVNLYNPELLANQANKIVVFTKACSMLIAHKVEG